jgi:hypothetical protein
MSLINILFCIFLVLKLTGFVAWSWWFVSMPLWLPLLAYISFAALAGTLGAVKGGKNGAQ